MYKRKNFPFKCVICGKESFGGRNRKFCSKKCQFEWTGKRSAWKGLPTGTVGAIQELRVAVDLLKRGYEVFRPLSPSCSCDLLVLKDGGIKKIEVRTAYERKYDNKLFYPNNNIKAEYLALALPDKIIYKPEF
jgi:hypothetical protein